MTATRKPSRTDDLARLARRIAAGDAAAAARAHELLCGASGTRPAAPGLVIVWRLRSGDYHVCLNGDERVWAAGKTLRDAIGDLMLNHYDVTGIDIVASAKRRKCAARGCRRRAGEKDVDPSRCSVHGRPRRMTR